MNNQLKKALRICIGVYLFAGGIVAFFTFVNMMGLDGFLVSLIPGLMCAFFTIFSTVSGYWLLKGTQKSHFDMGMVALLMQVIQIIVLRLSFRNYFGPFVAFGFSDTPEFHLIYDWEIVLYGFFNGLNKSSNEISLVINFFPMVLLVLLEKCRPVKAGTS